jgi:hypothetical protein
MYLFVQVGQLSAAEEPHSQQDQNAKYDKDELV